MDEVHKGTQGDSTVNWDALFQASCQKKACAIQWCLARNDYQEKRCKLELDAYKACCAQVKADHLAAQERSGA
ncbi:hypothetical protein SDRG_03409 [Saprolegnia diclina VS20]|uniref:CHCH domain-containing protein n=1 Tax=Saprolegnia diclina (strain VS20) TaxID=1156394 RepID=T0QM89_SAPDV|nr:hypothetical protein SDRG_03409 [Saprolegnia diclina VS20]EQC39204.1 hypothetical protein SDRG_03409 [Saprolegnia diclina VS20]|eukprot:XP_008607265.1 hypothetical protein SDRG_03409 [Saprolegnia diclina VS20]